MNSIAWMGDSLAGLRTALATLSGTTFGPDYLPTDDMVPTLRYAGEIYAAATREVNERLFKCEQLLGLGQRSEALRQAQIDPDLLKRYAELDIPGRQSWTEFAGRNGLPAPVALNSGAAAMLNAAFVTERASEPLLQQFRSLSLMRAPMPQRLNVLRLLVKAEPANVAWVDDLARFEQARCEEIRALAVRVRVQRDWELAAQLSEEVQSPQWVNRPPLDVIDAVIRARDEMRRTEAQRGLNVLRGRIDDAIRAGDLTAAEAVQTDIRQVMAEFALAPTDPLVEPFAEAFEWIEFERGQENRAGKFEKKLRELTKAIQDGQEWWFVEQCYRQACAFDLPISDDVLWSYRSAKKKRGAMRQVTIVGGVVFALVAVVIALLFIKK